MGALEKGLASIMDFAAQDLLDNRALPLVQHETTMIYGGLDDTLLIFTRRVILPIIALFILSGLLLLYKYAKTGKKKYLISGICGPIIIILLCYILFFIVGAGNVLKEAFLSLF
ncbi:MAG: hypothetical protein ABH950_07510 [Candidatus Altiarchaeota archaeon]